MGGLLLFSVNFTQPNQVELPYSILIVFVALKKTYSLVTNKNSSKYVGHNRKVAKFTKLKGQTGHQSKVFAQKKMKKSLIIFHIMKIATNI